MGLGADIRDLLTTGGITTSIFTGEAPEKPDECLTVTPTMGLGPTRTFSGTPGNAPHEHMRFQILSRAMTYAAAETNILAAYSKLSGVGERMLNFRRYYYIVPVATPGYIGIDPVNRAEFAANFDVWRAEST